MSNQSDRMRWSMDTRFVSLATAKPEALDQGMIARSPSDSARLTSYDEWLSKWTGNAY